MDAEHPSWVSDLTEQERKIYREFFVAPKALQYRPGYPATPYMRFSTQPEYCENMRQWFRMAILRNLPDDPSWKELDFFERYAISTGSIRLTRPFSSVHEVMLDTSPQVEGVPNPYTLVTHPEFRPAFERLEDMYQYGLHHQAVSPSRGIYRTHDHKRSNHVLDVGVNMEIVIRNNASFIQERTDLSEDMKEQILGHQAYNAVLAGIFHDIAMPLFSDVSLQAFPQLNEEDNFHTFLPVFTGKDPDRLKTEFGIDIPALSHWIHNQGLLGELLDVCDRMAYTARDVHEYLHRPSPETMSLRTASASPDPGESSSTSFYDPASVEEIMREDPLLFDLVLDFRFVMDEGKLRTVCTNPQRFGRFLKLRALMFQQLYLNPHNHGREFYLEKVLQYLVDSGAMPLTRLQYDRSHEGVTAFIGSMVRQGVLPHDPFLPRDDFFACETFPAVEQALERAEVLRQAYPSVELPVFIKRFEGFKPSTNFLMATPDLKHIHPFLESNPDLVAEVQGIVDTRKHYAVYYPRGFKDTNAGAFPSFLNAKSAENLQSFRS